MSNVIECEARGTADQQAVTRPWWTRLIGLLHWPADGPRLAPDPDDNVWAPLQHYPYGPPPG